MLVYLETAKAVRQPASTKIEYYQYSMNAIPKESGRCSDRQCPCPETVIPKGTGYLYIGPEAVGFMRVQMENRGGGSIPVIGSMPVLVCEQGAKLRGIDLDVAAEDAQLWWEKGQVPLRPTPKAKG
jgi:hypothetical protein